MSLSVTIQSEQLPWVTQTATIILFFCHFSLSIFSFHSVSLSPGWRVCSIAPVTCSISRDWFRSHNFLRWDSCIPNRFLPDLSPKIQLVERNYVTHLHICLLSFLASPWRYYRLPYKATYFPSICMTFKIKGKVSYFFICLSFMITTWWLQLNQWHETRVGLSVFSTGKMVWKHIPVVSFPHISLHFSSESAKLPAGVSPLRTHQSSGGDSGGVFVPWERTCSRDRRPGGHGHPTFTGNTHTFTIQNSLYTFLLTWVSKARDFFFSVRALWTPNSTTFLAPQLLQTRSTSTVRTACVKMRSKSWRYCWRI